METWLKIIFGSTLISGLIVWLIKSLGKHFLDKSFSAYNKQLDIKADGYRLGLEKSLESHKSNLHLLYAKASKLHDKRLEILAELYNLLVTMDFRMRELTAPFKEVQKDAEGEENERIRKGADSYNKFLEYYSTRKIFLSKNLARDLDHLRDEYLSSYRDYTFAKSVSSVSNLNIEKFRTAFKTISEDIPLVLGVVEDEFRNIIGSNDSESSSE
jgi:hypothetical protein